MKVIPALILLFLMAAPALAGDEYIKVRDMTMSLNRGDAVFELNYTLDSFAWVYVLALGCGSIEPDLASLLRSFGDARTIRADPYSAALLVRGAGRSNSGYYLFDSKPLGVRVYKLKVVYPGGMSRTFYNVTSTPNVFCES